MRRLDRYVLSEILGPLSLGFLVYTFILLLQFLFRSAELIIRRGLPAGTVGRLLVFSLPNIVVLTIPMALLFGVLIAIGRFSSDSELIAMRSCGVSLRSLCRPALLLGAVLTLLNVVLMYWVLPAGNRALQQVYLEVLTRTVAQQIEPRVFYSDFPGKVLYVFEVAPGGKRWQGVFLSDAVPGAKNEVVVADSGEIRMTGDGEQLLLHLEGATKHVLDFARPDRYEISRYRTLDLVLQDRFTSDHRKRLATSSKSVRELTVAELRTRIAAPETSAEERQLAWVEIHKKFSIPAACVVLALLAVPLGFTNRRGGRSSGFALSIGVIMAYWVLISQGEEAARVGRLHPALAMWLPNLILATAAIYLLERRDRDLPLLPAVLRRLPLWGRAQATMRRLVRRRVPVRRPAGALPAAPGGGHAPTAVAPLPVANDKRRFIVRLPRLRLRFPNLLDRYVLGILARIFGLVLLSGIALSVIGDFSENLDQILKNRPAAIVIADYYKYLSLQFAYDIAPIAVLVTTLVAFSLLGRTNEITALKALGTSLFRLGVPALVGAAVVALGAGLLQSEVLAASNQKVSELRDRIKGRTKPRSQRSVDQQWLVGEGHFIYNYLAYNDRSKTLQRLQAIQFDEQYRLAARLVADTAQYSTEGWVLSKGWVRDGEEFANFRRLATPTKIDLPELPDYFASEIRKPSELSYQDLRAYLQQLRDGGQAVPDLEVALANKLAFPFTSIVMAMVALPFAFRLGRQGALYGLGISVALGIVFFAVFALFKTLGEVGVFPALVAVWSPSLLFGLLAAYLFLGVRS